MILKLAGLVIEVKARYKFTYDMCFDYLYKGDEKPVFSTFATDEQIAEERTLSPGFSDAVLENTCIYRNICAEILKYDAVLIHSAAISVDNNAYLFSANSGTGKTTHMNLWLNKFGERAFVINGDKPIVRLIEGKPYVFGTPWCGKEGYNKNVSVPLKAFYILQRAEENNIRTAENKEALIFMLSQTSRPKQNNLYNIMLATIGNIIDSVQVYVLGCNMEQEACEVAYNKADEI
ncbi:MAG: hypothetical protein IJD30_04835 [Clostridia bacterium]|nr:hypothetical protein [Clostridia bacterium]